MANPACIAGKGRFVKVVSVWIRNVAGTEKRIRLRTAVSRIFAVSSEKSAAVASVWGEVFAEIIFRILERNAMNRACPVPPVLFATNVFVCRRNFAETASRIRERNVVSRAWDVSRVRFVDSACASEAFVAAMQKKTWERNAAKPVFWVVLGGSIANGAFVNPYLARTKNRSRVSNAASRAWRNVLQERSVTVARVWRAPVAAMESPRRRSNATMEM